MARSVSFNTGCQLVENWWQVITKWLSCNGEMCGVGPTAVFASAAAMFLFHELHTALFDPGNHEQVSLLEKTLISTMMLGMLSLMVHIWVCSTRFFQYYLDTLIKDSPNVLLEMTTAGLLGGKPELMALGPLTRFLRQQQPQIHITVCWFVSLCYADYVRKNYCTRFNLPYLEQWQAELQARARCGVRSTMLQVNSYIGSIHNRLHGCTPTETTTTLHSNCTDKISSALEISGTSSKTSWRRVCKHRASDVSSAWGPGPELHVQLLNQSSETTFEAIKKLTNYIKETRCSCSGAKDTSVAGVGATPTLSEHRDLPVDNASPLTR